MRRPLAGSTVKSHGESFGLGKVAPSQKKAFHGELTSDKVTVDDDDVALGMGNKDLENVNGCHGDWTIQGGFTEGVVDGEVAGFTEKVDLTRGCDENNFFEKLDRGCRELVAERTDEGEGSSSAQRNFGAVGVVQREVHALSPIITGSGNFKNKFINNRFNVLFDDKYSGHVFSGQRKHLGPAHFKKSTSQIHLNNQHLGSGRRTHNTAQIRSVSEGSITGLCGALISGQKSVGCQFKGA